MATRGVGVELQLTAIPATHDKIKIRHVVAVVFPNITLV